MKLVFDLLVIVVDLTEDPLLGLVLNAVVSSGIRFSMENTRIGMMSIRLLSTYLGLRSSQTKQGLSARLSIILSDWTGS